MIEKSTQLSVIQPNAVFFAFVHHDGAVGKVGASIHRFSATGAVNLPFQVYRTGSTRFPGRGQLGVLQLSGRESEHIGKLSYIEPAPLTLSTKVDVHPVNLDLFHSYLAARTVHPRSF